MTKYNLKVDQDYGSISMRPELNGVWVKASDAEDRIRLLKEALMNLKDCNMNLNTPADLNAYVRAVLEACK